MTDFSEILRCGLLISRIYFWRKMLAFGWLCLTQTFEAFQ